AREALEQLRCVRPVAEVGDPARLNRWLDLAREACATRLVGQEPAKQNEILKVLVARVVVHPPERREADKDRQRFRGAASVGKVDVYLPDWLERSLTLAPGDDHDQP